MLLSLNLILPRLLDLPSISWCGGSAEGLSPAGREVRAEGVPEQQRSRGADSDEDGELAAAIAASMQSYREEVTLSHHPLATAPATAPTFAPRASEPSHSLSPRHTLRPPP